MIDTIIEDIEEHFQKTYKDDAIKLWKEITEKYGVEYEVVGKDKILEPKDYLDALKKNFGSGTEGVKATFWFSKAIKEFSERIGELND